MILVLAVASVFRASHLGGPPHFDELYHLLAARGWLETGTFALADGIYTRAWHFTVLVAASIATFGESLAAARIPAVVFGVLWVLAVFLWTRHHAGRLAGVLAGLFMAVDPGAVNLSQLVRFYSLHGLAFWILAISVFSLTRAPFDRSRLPVLGVAMLSAIVAFSVQVTTLIGLVALGTWFSLRTGPALIRGVRDNRAARRLAAGFVFVGGAVLLALFFLSGMAAELWARYQSSPLWVAGRREDVLWYFNWLRERFHGFWALFPLATLIAVHRFRAPAAFCAVVFAVVLALHSGAGSKAERYFYYAMPCFMILWAMALATLLPAIWRMAEEVVRSVMPARPARTATLGVMVIALLFAVYATPLNWTVRRMLVPDVIRPYAEPNWSAASAILRPIADSADVVVSGSLPKAIYFLDRGDVALGVTELAELSPGDAVPAEFTIDHRTGRPSISRPESLEELMAFHASGLVIVERQQWQHQFLVPPAVAEFLVTHMEPVDLPEEWGVLAYRWPRIGPEEG